MDSTLPKAGQAQNIWRYYGTKTIIQSNEHIANIPIHHLVYGCQVVTQGTRYRITPSRNVDNLTKYIDGAMPGHEPYVMLTVDQNDQIRVWSNQF